MAKSDSMDTWKPVVAGIDESPEGIHAATLACTIAQAADVPCWLVHGTPSAWAAASAPDLPLDVQALNEAVIAATDTRLRDTLAPVVAPEVLQNLRVDLGSPAIVLKDAVAELNAGLVVLGGKHHPGIMRWFGGSTVHNVVRTTRVPVLVSKGGGATFRRVLAAADVSYAASPTIAEAHRFANLFDADLRVLHVVEPLPVLATLPVALEDAEYRALAEEEFDRVLRVVLQDHSVERHVVSGDPTDAVAEHVAAWQADLLVIGSHGKGWVDRLLVGSTTERLLNDLPTNLLVVRVPEPQGSTAFREE